ncbi:DUF605-domain-containing protein [Gyrodon lividus]|nr:DUF605-domain-containing protein [Gyrodon lividus]
MSLGLPPVSSGLKTIAPYLQRAEELVAREPVIAYWCAYYAAQVGITLKAQDTGSRNLLFNLLNALERLKKEIGPNDAIDIEPASVAYVENFAFKVFKMADDEDRAGMASKSTARKFLAAANFFEVLRVFPKIEVSESTEDKLKYAKWKAADIAKAFREGRQPAPGPPGSQLDPELASMTAPPLTLNPSTSQIQPTTPRQPSPAMGASSTRSTKRQSPPPSISPADIARANRLPIHPAEGKHDDEALSPGRWSTTATPGLDNMGNVGGSTDSVNNWHEHVIDPLTRATAGVGGSKLRTTWVSTEMETAGSDEEGVRDPVLNGEGSRGRVRFSPAREPIIPIETSPPPASHIPTSSSPPRSSPPRSSSPRSSPPRSSPPRSSPPRTSPPRPPKRSPSVTLSDLPPGFVPIGPPRCVLGSGSGISPPSSASAHSFIVPPPPPPAPSGQAVPSPSAPTFITPFVPPPPLAPRAVELTPSVIAKAQRHCRFAISSLDYEDAEHAIKELRTALEILGG